MLTTNNFTEFSMKTTTFLNSHKNIYLIPKQFTLYFLSIFFIFSSCGNDPVKKSYILNKKLAEDIKYLSDFEKQLRGDTLKTETSYDLYFDFSSTMKRGVTDKIYGQLIQDAFYKIEPSDNLYSIGENPELKLITGTNVEKQNQVLGVVNYTQNMTYMTNNINNIISHLQKPAVIFSDFSIDEGKPSRDMDGITSSFVRGPEYKKQFSEWLMSGGSIRIYGKYIVEKGSKMPIYAIAFLPSCYSSTHRVNGILELLENNLKADIYFDLHPNFVTITTPPNNSVFLSDIHKIGKNTKSHYLLENNLGELLLFSASEFINKIKPFQKEVETTFFGGLGWRDNNTSYLQEPIFTSEITEIAPENNKKLSSKLNPKAIPIFNQLNTVDTVFQIPMNFKEACQPKYYKQQLHLIRYSIQISGCSNKPRWDKEKASACLQYKLNSGNKPLLNTCLYESIDQSLEIASSSKRLTTVYSIYSFIK